MRSDSMLAVIAENEIIHGNRDTQPEDIQDIYYGWLDGGDDITAGESKRVVEIMKNAEIDVTFPDLFGCKRCGRYEDSPGFDELWCGGLESGIGRHDFGD